MTSITGKPKKAFTLFTLFLLSTIFPQVVANQEPLRTFTDNKGRTMEARIVRFQDGGVVIQRSDGKVFSLSPDVLSPDDQAYIAERRSQINPKTNRPWVANDFKIILTKEKQWTCELKPGAYKHLVKFTLDKIDLDKDDLPDGNKISHQTSRGNKYYDIRFGTWEVDDSGNVTSTLGDWKYDKRSKNLIPKRPCCSCGKCRGVLMPHLKQLEFEKR